MCGYLGIPLAEDKIEGPSSCLVFLGIEIDTVAGEVRLPVGKLKSLASDLPGWVSRKKCTRRELESITGKLQHAAKVVRSGRTFVRRLFDLIAKFKKPDHHIKLNASARSDLAWWCHFVEMWNGVSLLHCIGSLVPTNVVTSDVSGWGCGGYWVDKWFQLAWSSTRVSSSVNIAVKELIPIVLAAAVWGQWWQDGVVLCRCDNEAVVAIIKSRTSRDIELMHMLRCLAFIEAKFSCTIIAVHLPGVNNSLADDLSRDRLASFLQSAPGPLSQVPTTLSPRLLELTCNSKPDWTSPSWNRMFRDFVFSV